MNAVLMFGLLVFTLCNSGWSAAVLLGRVSPAKAKTLLWVSLVGLLIVGGGYAAGLAH